VRLQLNLARKEKKAVFVPLVIYLGLIALIMVSLWYQYRFHYMECLQAREMKREELGLVEKELAEIEKPAAGPEFFAVSVEGVNAQIESFNTLIEGKNFKWSGFLRTLEQTVPDQMSVESIRFSLNELSGIIEGKSQKFSSVLKLVRRLQDAGTLRDVFLIYHGKEKIKGTEDEEVYRYRICFTLEKEKTESTL